MPSLSVDVPLVKSYVAKMAAQGISNQLVTLLELSEPLNGGAHYPLFLLVLQQLHKLHGSDWVTTTSQESKINLQDMLPGMNKTSLCLRSCSSMEVVFSKSDRALICVVLLLNFCLQSLTAARTV